MKDAKGHGSDARGSNTTSAQRTNARYDKIWAKAQQLNPEKFGAPKADMVFSSKAGVGGLGAGVYARLNDGSMVKLNAAATDGMIPRVGTPIDPSEHTTVPGYGAAGVAAQHGIDTSHLSGGGTYAQSAEGRAKFGPFADAIAGFREKYGAPRDHAAEQRGFNSGQREINRLKRQGK